MSNKNEKFQETNSNCESVIILKNNEQLRKNKLVIFPIPINITKSKYRDIKYLSKKELSFNSFLFPNYSLNSTKNLSISKEKSKSKSKSKDSHYYDITISNKFRKYRDDLQQTKIKKNNITETISENKRNLLELKNELKSLEINKRILKKDLQNKISNMETLEENYKNIINDINNNDINNKFYLNAYENLSMELTLGDIKINNKETYIKRIFETFNKLNIIEYQKNQFLEFITMVVSKAYLDFFIYLNNKKKSNINSMIDNFFNAISSGIISYKNICKLSQIVSKLILKILFKINILSESIGDTIDYLKNKYEKKKNELNQKIEEIENLMMELNKQKLNLELIEKNKKENLEFFSIKNTPFCEKTVSKTKDKKKELALSNKISSIIRIYTEYNNNKSKSYTLKKKTIRKIHKNGKKNLSKFLTSNCKDTNDIHSQDYSRCQSNLSQSKLSTNGISIICSPPENKSKNKFKSKINLNLNNKLNNLINISKNEEANIEKNNKLKEYEYNIINKSNNSFAKKIFKEHDSFMKNHKFFKKIKNMTKIIKHIEDKSNLIMPTKNKDFNASNKEQKKINNLSYADSFKNLKISKNKSGYSISSRKNIKYNNNIIYKSPIESNGNKKIITKFKKISINKSLISNREKPNKIQISINNSERNEISKIKNNLKKTDIMESFCYYKLIEKNENLFNPLNIKLNLNKLGYNEGFISISSNQLYLVLKPKNELEINSQKNLLNIYYNNNAYYTLNSIVHKNNINSTVNNNNTIKLKKINKIYIDKTMQNIIKIRKIFIKYNNYNEKTPKKNIYINKILNEKEIVNIKEMEQSEKIRAALCNFFSFVIEFDNDKNMEIVLANFCQFVTWFKYLEDIVRKNKNSNYKYLVPNGNNSNLLKYKRNISKIQSNNNGNSNGQRENLFAKRSFSEKNNDKYFV